MRFSLLSLALAGPSLVHSAAIGQELAERATSPPPPNPTAVLALLALAATEEQRLNLLVPDPTNISNLTFQFANNSVVRPTGGTIELASVSVFPALLGTNVAMAIGFVNPCGLNVPHTHLRANEFLTVIQGQMVSGVIAENNPGSTGNVTGSGSKPSDLQGPLPQYTTTLGLYQGMLIPQGSGKGGTSFLEARTPSLIIIQVHFQYNPTCSPAIFASAFDNNDPGRVQVARAFFSIPTDDYIETAIGNSGAITPANIDAVRKQLPSSYALIVDSCAKKCGLRYGA